MIAFYLTDLPCPVAPATKRWGIFVRSKVYVSLEMVLPKATGKAYLDSWNFLEAMIPRMETTSGFWFGTSMPMIRKP